MITIAGTPAAGSTTYEALGDSVLADFIFVEQIASVRNSLTDSVTGFGIPNQQGFFSLAQL